MPQPDLTESAWNRATAGAAHVYKSVAFQVATALLTILAGAIAAVAAADENTTRQIAVPVVCGVAALLIAFLAVFFVQLLTAPLQQRNELRAAWTVPVAGEQPRPFSLELELRQFYRRGDDLAMRLEQRGNSTRADRDAATAWADEVGEVLAEHAPEELARIFMEAGTGAKLGGAAAGPITRLRARVDALHTVLGQLD